MEKWQLYTLIAIVFWGTAQIFIKKGLSRLKPLDAFFLGGLVGFAILFPYALAIGIEISPDPVIFLICFYIVLAYLSYYVGIYMGKLAISATIISTYPMVTVILAYIFLDDRILNHQIAAIAAIIGGTAFLASAENRAGGRSPAFVMKSAIVLPVVAAIAIGVCDVFTKVVIDRHGIDDLIIYTTVTQMILGTLLKFLKEKKQFSLHVFKVWESMVGSAIITLGTIFFFEGLKAGKASLVIPLSSAYAPLTVVLSVLFLRERFRLKVWAAILTILAGVILINI